ncbi:MAG: response regulator transcription factor [Crocinitomicaceae bacterium]|jgi:two-component system OmpR family response regulator|nr:response regulator transcription factor [Crocinitomicaceae bacterium]MCF8433931.1 response regulator transcription factor [Crocinitomicaceae bacterium]MDP5011412.1 response regulator transcription factor [Crocinitomicaceae bacterium]
MSKALNILLAEDDENLGKLLHTYLKTKGFEVDLARNGKIAFERFNSSTYNFCIFDVMMPEMDGFTLAKEIREIDKKVPILFLTAKSMKDDKLQGFSVGADDYLTKPFSMEELLARITAILRRSESNNEKTVNEELFIGKIKYEPELRLLHLEEGVKKLTTKENQLLQLLVKNENEILDRQATLRAIWGDDNYFNGRSMDVYIAKLRKLLREDEAIEIMNVHGKGFKFLIK